MDASYQARAAVTVLNGGLIYRDVPYTYPPPYAYSEAASIALMGNNAFGWKFVGQLYDFGSVVLIYLLASVVFGRNKGLLAAALYGFSPLPILATNYFATFDSAAVFWTSASLLLLFKKKNVPSAMALGVGAAYKYFPFLLLIPAVVSVVGKKNRALYLASSIGAFVVFQLPFMFMTFSSWLDNVVLYHLNRPALGASVYNLVSPSPQLFGVQTPMTLLFPVVVFLVYLFLLVDQDKSEFGLLKQAAFVMVAGVFFSKVVLTPYALWYLPLLCMFVVALKKRTLVLVLVPFFALQVSIFLGGYVFVVFGDLHGALVWCYVYLFSSGSLLAWLFRDRLLSVLRQRNLVRKV